MGEKNHSYRYYAHKLRSAINYLLVLTVVNIVLVLMFVYEYGSIPATKFYASSDVGEITLLKAMDKSKKSIL